MQQFAYQYQSFIKYLIQGDFAHDNDNLLSLNENASLFTVAEKTIGLYQV